MQARRRRCALRAVAPNTAEEERVGAGRRGGESASLLPASVLYVVFPGSRIVLIRHSLQLRYVRVCVFLKLAALRTT